MEKWQRLALETGLSLASGRTPPRPAEIGDPGLEIEGLITDGFALYLVDKSLVETIRNAAKDRVKGLALECVTGVLTQWKLAARLEELTKACYLAKDSRAELVYALWKRVFFLRDREKAKTIIDAVVSTVRSHFNLE